MLSITDFNRYKSVIDIEWYRLYRLISDIDFYRLTTPGFSFSASKSAHKIRPYALNSTKNYETFELREISAENAPKNIWISIPNQKYTNWIFENFCRTFFRKWRQPCDIYPKLCGPQQSENCRTSWEPMKWWHPDCSKQATRFTVTFSFLKFSTPYNWGKLKKMRGRKRPNPKKIHYCLWKTILNRQNLRRFLL